MRTRMPRRPTPGPRRPLQPPQPGGGPATPAEITSVYRRVVCACHPNTSAHPDRERLAAVLAAYHPLRDQRHDCDRHATHPQQPQKIRKPPGGTTISVRVHYPDTRRVPDLRAGPVSHYPLGTYSNLPRYPRHARAHPYVRVLRIGGVNKRGARPNGRAPSRGNEPVLTPMYAELSWRSPPSRPFLNLLRVSRVPALALPRASASEPVHRL